MGLEDPTVTQRFGTVVPLAMLNFELRSLILRVPEKFGEFSISGQTTGKVSGIEVNVSMWLRGKEVVEYLLFFQCWLFIRKLVSKPVTVEDFI